MTPFDTISWILGANLSLGTIAAIFARAWIRVSRIDKLEVEVDKIWERVTEVQILSNEIEVCKQGITEIKELLKEHRKTNV